MQIRYTIILLGLLISIPSCGQIDPNKQIDEGIINKNIYYSKEIGWTIKIPKGWNITQREVTKNRENKGLKALNQTAGIDYDVSGLKQLISFQKDRFHIFQSSSEKGELEYEGEWEDSKKRVNELLHETYISRGMKVDTISSKEMVDNLEFNVFHITIYGPQGNVILYQDLYSKYINGYDFGVNLNYINDKEKNELIKAWKHSKFK